MTSTLNPTLRWTVAAALQGHLSFEQAHQRLEDWPASTPRERREKSEALLLLSALARSPKSR